MESTAADERSAGVVPADAISAGTVSAGVASAGAASADAAFEAVVDAVAVLAELRRRRRGCQIVCVGEL